MTKIFATSEEINKIQEEYRNTNPSFVPYSLSDQQIKDLGSKYSNLLKVQNGEGVDDAECPEETNRIKLYLQKYVGQKVLFLGAGSGREIRTGLHYGLDAYGVTLGSRNVDFGKKYLDLEGRIFESTVEMLPWPRETFDLVAGFHVFEHTMSPLLFLLEAGRVLKYGGKIFLEWPGPKNHTGGENPHHIICYTPGQAEGLLLKAGFRDINLSYAPTKIAIPKEDYWRGDQESYFIIEGTKVPTQASYIRDAWNKENR